ncbi:bifunctional adenosylcobinamide kinase/adenosylcobinamide-phosphate guanylyltransferase [Herminiimonas sp. NPDC097707]|uniref:bifunctional adenosylcobinamide kinase/adenosylcobinamide-phosphate guanylyltransferase n=1 Tax=Herminiimonas sp. NPDC097707 TaxID=3364007 RepID=UPI00383B6B73
MTRTLIIGGARSGKSAHAEALAIASGKQLVYIATAQAQDEEMSVRIRHHREHRDEQWQTVEEPIALGAALAGHSGPDTLVMVDCLTVWLSNLLFSEAKDFPEIGLINPPASFHRERALFLQALEQAKGDVILVSNEVGQGIVPQGAVSRWFVDEAGRLNQAVAACCERAIFIVAGLPLTLKG